jgi:GNAT superfamily N-acetyltransferase
MTIQIRKAAIEDLPIIYSFELAYILEIEPAAEAAWKNSMPGLLRQWIDNLPRMHLAVKGKDPIGHFFWQMEGKTALLASIFVTPSFRREGVGLSLLKRYEHDARENGFLHLKIGVHESNPASALYKAAGYHYSRRKDEYDYYEKELS